VKLFSFGFFFRLKTIIWSASNVTFVREEMHHPITFVREEMYPMTQCTKELPCTPFVVFVRSRLAFFLSFSLSFSLPPSLVHTLSRRYTQSPYFNADFAFFLNCSWRERERLLTAIGFLSAQKIDWKVLAVKFDALSVHFESSTLEYLDFG
jgi:hypothetical protein